MFSVNLTSFIKLNFTSVILENKYQLFYCFYFPQNKIVKHIDTFLIQTEDIYSQKKKNTVITELN